MIRLTITALCGLVVLLSPVVLLPTRAGELRVSQANDFLVGNEIKDDLYTFSAAFSFKQGRLKINLAENAFTDREQDIRFDETYFTVSQGFLLPRYVELEVEAGAVHVGRGLFGERAQNALHRVIGDKEVELPYLDQDRFHALGRVKVRRNFHVARRLWLEPEVSVESAFRFRNDFRAGVGAVWRKSPNFSLLGSIGYHRVDTDLQPLEIRLKPSAGTWEAGFELYSNWAFVWSHNEFGTGNRHLRVDYRWRPERRMTAPQPRKK